MSNAKNIIHYIAEDDLSGALTAFKGAMSEKLIEAIDKRTNEIQQEISEQYPEIFDSEADKEFVAKHSGDVVDHPVADVDQPVDREQGHREADYDDDEDQQVNEESEEDLEEESDDDSDDEE